MKVDAEKLIPKLKIKIDWWRNTQEDPHNIANAVIVTLTELRACLIDLVHEEQRANQKLKESK